MIQPYVEVMGKGSDLVLLHGWGMHGDIFAGIVPTLAEHHRVHCVDLPGFGRSPLPNGAYSLAMLREQILSVTPQRATWLGWSMGGLLAMSLALSDPQRVDRLITVASSPRFIQAPDWPCAMKPEVLEQFMSLLLEDYRGTLIRFLAIQTLGSETQKDDIALLKECVFRHGEPAPRALRGGLELLKSTDLRKDLGAIAVPWLRLYGRLDGLVPVASAEAVSKLHPKSRAVIFPKASHAPFISHPAEFLDTVMTFLESSKHE
jgi:pimeloyl-[acyl-carrier protein] methyl ester esterase